MRHIYATYFSGLCSYSYNHTILNYKLYTYKK